MRKYLNIAIQLVFQFAMYAAGWWLLYTAEALRSRPMAFSVSQYGTNDSALVVSGLTAIAMIFFITGAMIGLGHVKV